MKILLYGGTFDPPHNGHLNNLRAAAERVRPDRIIVMPAGVPPHKAASATPAVLRMEMCACFGELAKGPQPMVPILEVSDWEIAQSEAGMRNYTVLTLEMLAQSYPDARLYLTLGSDMLLSFGRWYRWQDILRLAQAVVVSREIGDNAALHEKAKELNPTGSRILLTQAPTLPMASSDLRARLAAGDPCEDALPQCVRDVIAREGLYKTVE
jgi:nicotinate-nucleotide adenylyltransferase